MHLQAAGLSQGEFTWDEVQQSVILSSFFWGYLIFQIPGGRIAEVVGAKRVFGGAVLINGALSLVLPFLARTHWILLLVIRALQGLAQVSFKHGRVLPVHDRSAVLRAREPLFAVISLSAAEGGKRRVSDSVGLPSRHSRHVSRGPPAQGTPHPSLSQ
jgi:MFS family permease